VSEISAPADIDALFQLPLGEFTAARNALASQLKKDGRHAEATEVKALTKPSASAWVVNQLFWRHRKLFDRLLESGDRLRRAHAERLTGHAARDPVTERREAVAELATRAADLLKEAGHGGTRDLIRRVTSTLDALSSYGSLPNAPAAGRLTDDLEPPGFEAALGLMPAAGKRAAEGPPIQMRVPGVEPPAKRANVAKETAAAARRAEEDRKRLAAAAKADVRTAEHALNLARKQAERATATLEKAAARAKAIDAERAQMEKRLARIAKDAEAAHTEARDAAATAERATQAAADAERALELARNGLQKSPTGASRGSS
jgi:hypothetical protein